MRALRWFLVNGIVVACAWFGYVCGNQYCENIFVFVSWGVFIIGVLTPALPSKSKIDLQKKGRSVHQSISVSSDLFLALFCAAYGHWFYATAWIVSMAAEHHVYSFTQKEESNAKET